MKRAWPLLLLGLCLVGCGSSGDGNTEDAAKQVREMSAKGGNLPNPDLPIPGAGPPGGPGKTGKFRPAGG